MNKIDIKPLSVNKAYKGRRFRTEEYNIYIIQVRNKLQKILIPEGKLSIRYKVGYSSESSDTDNCIKPFQDIISKYYGFNDKLIYHFDVEKEIVKKGNEYISFEILPYKNALQ